MEIYRSSEEYSPPFYHKCYSLRIRDWKQEIYPLGALRTARASDASLGGNREFNTYFEGEIWGELFQVAPTAVVDSIFKTDNFLHVSTAAGQIRFYPEVGPGFSWIDSIDGQPGHDAIKFTCTEVLVEDIFGITDSVKTFRLEAMEAGAEVSSPYDGITYRLTKHFGFLEFTPLDSLFSEILPVYQVAGWERGGEKRGFTSRFENYFAHFAPGQVYKYLETRSGFDVPEFGGVFEKEYQRDSIITVNFGPDEMTVKYHRKARVDVYVGSGNHPDEYIIGEQILLEEMFERTYLREDYEPLINESTPAWFEMDVEDFSGPGYYLLSPLAIDSMGSIQFYAVQGENYLPDCVLSPADNCRQPIDLRTGVGVAYEGFYCLSMAHYRELLGYQTETDTVGDVSTPIIVANQEITLSEKTLEIFPNPATEEAVVLIPEELSGSSLKIEVRDVFGRLVQADRISWGSGQYTLPITYLPAGFYIIILRGNEKMASGVLVKN